MASIPNQWIANAAEPKLKEAVAVDQRKLGPGFAGRIPNWIVRHGRGPGSGGPPIRREGLVAINYYSVLARELAALHPMDGR